MSGEIVRERSRSKSKESAGREASEREEEDSVEESQDSSHEYNGDNHESLDKMYTSLIEYKNNLFKIDTLISIEKDEAQVAEFVKFKNNLNQAIEYQENNIKIQQKSDSFIFNTERLRPEFRDRVAPSLPDLLCLACEAPQVVQRAHHACRPRHAARQSAVARLPRHRHPQGDVREDASPARREQAGAGRSLRSNQPAGRQVAGRDGREDSRQGVPGEVPQERQQRGSLS